MIIDKRVGTVTLFSFDNRQELSKHTSSFNVTVFILEGEAEITISGKPLQVRQGEGVMMPAGKPPHSPKAENQFKMLLTMIQS